MSALPDDAVAADAAARTFPENTPDDERVLYALPSPPNPPEQDEPGESRAWQGVRRSWEAVADTWQPPRVWSEDLPSAAAELNRARHGTHLQPYGPLRTAAVAYATVVGVVNTKDRVKIWVRAHPARMVTATIVVGLLLASPARKIVVWLLFGIPHLIFEALM